MERGRQRDGIGRLRRRRLFLQNCTSPRTIDRVPVPVDHRCGDRDRPHLHLQGPRSVGWRDRSQPRDHRCGARAFHARVDPSHRLAPDRRPAGRTGRQPDARHPWAVVARVLARAWPCLIHHRGLWLLHTLAAGERSKIVLRFLPFFTSSAHRSSLSRHRRNDRPRAHRAHRRPTSRWRSLPGLSSRNPSRRHRSPRRRRHCP